MKKVYKIYSFFLLTFLLVGCYGRIPAKMFNKPNKFGLDVMIPTHWDGQYPVRYWETTIEDGDIFMDFNGIVWKVEKHPDKPNTLILRTDITE